MIGEDRKRHSHFSTNNALALSSIGKVFVIAIILDFIFQYIVLHQFRVIGALLAGVILAIVPYVLLRGPVNRIMRFRYERPKQ